MLVSESRAGATLLARAMMVDPHQLLSGRYAALPPDNHPVAISTEPLAGFPRYGKAYAILTSGCATLADHHKYAGRPGCKDDGIAVRGVRDLTVLRLVVRVPHNANCLSFRFRYLSQEFPKYVGSQYNDGFIAELDYTNWNSGLNGPNDPHISAPHDFAKDSKGNIISVQRCRPGHDERRLREGHHLRRGDTGSARLDSGHARNPLLVPLDLRSRRPVLRLGGVHRPAHAQQPLPVHVRDRRHPVGRIAATRWGAGRCGGRPLSR